MTNGFNTEEKQSNYMVSTLVHALFENKKFKEKLKNEFEELIAVHEHYSSKPNLYSFEEVMNITGLARGTIYLQMKEGTFPQSIKLGKKRVVWTTESIQKWLDDLVEKNGRMLD
tara:strand:+ start:930 stop:1271 length:342 start_codon:yes stop_codon:yes gene_type:complete